MSTIKQAFKSTNGKPKSSKEDHSNLIERVKKGLEIEWNTSTLSALVDVVKHTESIDDRKLLLEHILTFASNLEEGEFSQKVQDEIVKLLYNDLSHPPATSIGQYAYRSADGSGNNVNVPDMGKAHSPYARTVQQQHPLPTNELPDPGLVFDVLLKRDKFVKHPAGLNSLFFSFAALVIHTVFRTSHTDVNENETSSYVDLSPLYGHDQDAQNRVRRKEGRGHLLPDCFAEDRLLLLPPAVCALLVLFSRNHNYIADKLLEINERGTFRDPATLQGDALVRQDEELFQTARLINCGWFGSVVFSDYFSCILGLVRQGSSWSLNPFGEIRNADHSEFERGEGNVCSVEFNCLYRWHATTSAEDEKWVVQLFNNIFEGKGPDDVTPNDFKAAIVRIKKMQPDISDWTFGGMQRQENGSFRDEDLAKIIHDATEHPAGAFKARGTPAVMRLHEIMGIMQNRAWGVCSLNDFRRYLGLKPYDSFLDWNSDPEIADVAQKLYGHIERLELYVGLQAEEAKPVVEGAGLCPGYTISRAILSDAIALTRGDRYFTYDYTPFNLTAWGFADCQRDPNAFGFGSTLGRLILRTLPSNFTENSVYTFFPLMLPDAMKTHLKKLDVLEQYDLKRPGTTPRSQHVRDYAQVSTILKSADFAAPYAEKAAKVIKGSGFFTVSPNDKDVAEVLKGLSDSDEARNEIARYFHDQIRKLMEKNAFIPVSETWISVDIVRDVFKVVPVLWVAQEIAGLKLKFKEDDDDGLYTARELYDILGDIYTAVFLEVEPAKVMVLRAKVKKNVQTLTQQIKSNLGTARASILGLANLFSRSDSSKKSSRHTELVKYLKSIGRSTDQIANTILAFMVCASVELSIAFTNMINLYIDEKDKSVFTKSDEAKLEMFVREALRLDPPVRGVYRISKQDVSVQGADFKKDTRVFLDVAKASRDSQTFAAPDEVNTTRSPKEAYLLGYADCSRCLGESLYLKVMTETLKAVFSFEKIERSEGQSGKLKRYHDHAYEELCFAYLDYGKTPAPWPTSMCVQFVPPK